MKTVLIILGVARSGSTLLAKTLGGHSSCMAIGEINHFNHEIKNQETLCGCGQKLIECDFWKLVQSELNEKLAIDINRQNSSFKVGIFKQLTNNLIYKLIPTIIFKTKYKNKNVDSEIVNTLDLYNTIFKLSDSQVLIDSTKGLFRALVLASRSKQDIQFKYIHLTRDGRGVLNSSLKSSYSVTHLDGITRVYNENNRKKPNDIINSWLYINIRNFIILKFFRNKETIFVKYEEFTSNPTEVLNNIYKRVDLNYQDSVLNLGENENHILGGNASRINAKSIRKKDDSWRLNSDNILIRKFNKRAGFLNKLLGY